MANKKICLLPLIFSPLSSYGATCSCAAVPLLDTMNSGSPDKKSWYLSSTYEYHDISDLVSGDDEVSDETGRDRTSQSMVLEASYGLSERFSISGLFSYVEHERRIGPGTSVKSRGLGDSIVMLKYSPRKVRVYSRTGFSAGLGARLPLGEDDETNRGITLAEDMQPSTGAYGTIIWLHTDRAFSQAANFQLHGTLTYTANEENDRDYQFGDSLTVNAGLSYQLPDSRWGFSGVLMYRDADRDERAGTEIPNTGGKWLDVGISAQYHVSESLALRATAKIPLERDLNDALQFTTSHALSISVALTL